MSTPLRSTAAMAARRMLHTAAKGAAAVSPAEFATFLGNAVTAAAALRNMKREVPDEIALGVSGGVDSMALALLASKLATFENEFSNTQFLAVIIDHGLREGSAAEADGVEETMRRLGLNSRRLAFNWKFDPEAAKGMESIARRRRYRSFVEVCAENDIEHLVTAHHGNDQAETVLMRLLAESASSVAGLAGIRPAAPVPECSDVYGAENITLLRPFLGVLKNRLRTTLEDDKITWFEDPTNRDPALTPRNAIRAFMSPPNSTPQLPTALQPASLIALSERIAAQNDKVADNVDWFLARCVCRHVRESGVIECLIPTKLLNFPPEFLARVIARLAAVVSPLDRVDMTQMEKVVHTILSANNARGAPAKPAKETVDDNWHPKQEDGWHLQAEPARRKAATKRSPLDKAQYADGAITSNNVFWEAAYTPPLGGAHEGVLLRCYRQPYIRASLKQSHDTPQIPLTPENAGIWHLWDGRFWIRFTGGPDHEFWNTLKEERVRSWILTGTRKEVMLRYAEFGFVGDAESKTKVRDLAKRLKTDAPGKAKSVLPVVCEVGVAKVKKWKEPLKVVAFPTFGIMSEGARGGEWDWRPKRDLVVGGRVIDRTPVMVATLKK
ncbi:hypothetical protein ABW21_db0208952 [Orbilia brochopaga]|nr:hypothetical protein ABW21_db0208952 [Drechslerella brochopaga]